MRFLIAPDKFKGTLSAMEVAKAIALGIKDVIPSAEIDLCPVADGGEGTVEILQRAMGGEWIGCRAHDALGRALETRFLWQPETRRAAFEISATIGLQQLAANERDPGRATSFGAGEVMAAALKKRPHQLLIGLGGSATNDGGFGMARALGYRFLADGRELTDGPDELAKLTTLRAPADWPPPSEIIGAVDVDHPLLGPSGATNMFAEQKGASPEDKHRLEDSLRTLAEVAARVTGREASAVPGAGAAGGLGFGLIAFCGGKLRPGFEVVAQAVKLEERIQRADYVITGEGRLDEQTLAGKAPAGVARAARRHQKQVFAIVGEQTSESAMATALFHGIQVLIRPPITRGLAIRRCRELIRERAAELVGFLERR